MLEINFEAEGMSDGVAARIEQEVRKITGLLRCPDHFPGRISVRVEGADIQVVDACCDTFLREVRNVIKDAFK